MRELEYPRLWLAVWAFGWLLCIVLSLIQPPDLGIEVRDGDKIGHLLAYATLSAWSVFLFVSARARWTSALGLVLLGLLLEAAQGMLTEHRLMDARDALANTLGVMLGQCIAWMPARGFLQWLETRWRRFRELDSV